MNKSYFLISAILFMQCTIMAISLAKKKPKVLTDYKKQYKFHELSPTIGKIVNGDWIRFICIEKGLIGMPNIADLSYRGTYKNDQGKTCFAFVLKADGIIYVNDKPKKVYRSGNTGFLEDLSAIRIDCYPAEIAVRIAPSKEYLGHYIDQQHKQCHVYRKKTN